MPKPSAVQFVDDAWLHMGGAGYNDYCASKGALFETIGDALDQGVDWQQMLAFPDEPDQVPMPTAVAGTPAVLREPYAPE